MTRAWEWETKVPDMLLPGDPLPTLYARSSANPRYWLNSNAGRNVVVSFIGGLGVPGADAFLERLYADPLFDDVHASCFVVCNTAADEASGQLADRLPGIRVLWDTDLALARAFGRVSAGADGAERLSLASYVLDPGLRILKVIAAEDFVAHHAELSHCVAALPAPDAAGHAPVLVAPGILEPELCRAFIAYADTHGLEPSGFMRSDLATGQTQLVVDPSHKRRSDCTIADTGLREALTTRLRRRLVPQIERAFQFRATRIERHIVACYDAAEGGWFHPHRDNTTSGTAHRRFAVSINLNAEDHEGGDLRFPEFGRRTYRAPTGGAVVFSCSLIHEATPIRRGRRYCILPFLYDEAAAAIRLENARHIADPELRRDVLASVGRPAT